MAARALSLKQATIQGSKKQKSGRSSSESSGSSGESTGTTPAPIGDKCGSENDESELETISAKTSDIAILQSRPPSISPPPANPGMSTIESKDMGYFSFFLEEMKHITADFTETFPTYIRDSFAYSIENDALRNAVIAASAIIIDRRQRKDLERFHHHRQLTYCNVRQQLATGEYDVPLLAAIFWTQYMDLIYGDLDAAIKHNMGLYLVLQHLLNRDGKNWHEGGRANVPPLCLLMWRHGIRSDIILSFWMNGSQMTFPQIPREEEYLHRGWMENYGRVSEKEDVGEWALASFNLDAFLHRACHVVNDFMKFRVNGVFPYDIYLQFESAKESLIKEHMEWWDRPIIQKARREEMHPCHVSNEPNADRFLHYPPFPPIKNHLFMLLRNQWYANYIYLSLLNYKPHESRPCDPRRIHHAVEICRIYAATGVKNFPGFELLALIMAAVAFAESPAYERESTWIYERIVKGRGPGTNWMIITHLYDRLGELWGKQYYSWDIVE
jgi:hypothetical protein